MVPYPFTRGLFLYGEPIWVPREADEQSMESARQALQSTLNRLTEEAEQACMAQPSALSR
jgi:hypothetical protein